jgi:hypothetical protein
MLKSSRKRRVGYVPGDVGRVKHGKALVVLQVGDAEVALEADDFGIANIGAVEEGAEEEEGEDGEDSVAVSDLHYYFHHFL